MHPSWNHARLRHTLVLFALLIAALALAACANPTPTATEVPDVPGPAPVQTPATAAVTAPEGNLRVAMEIPVQLDPAFASSDSEIAILNAVYDYLVDVNEKNDIEPRLAKHWSHQRRWPHLHLHPGGRRRLPRWQPRHRPGRGVDVRPPARPHPRTAHRRPLRQHREHHRP